MSTGPARGAEVGAVAIQLFTKTPNQWREPPLVPEEVERFKSEMVRNRIEVAVAHDSYLINLASPDDKLRAKSLKCFTGELERCRAYGIPYVVSHPGNYMDDHDAGLRRNALAYATALADTGGDVGVLIEGTAGAGTALGRTFEELRDLRDGMPEGVRHRVGFCLDTAHLHAAGYDVVGNVSGVLDEFDRTVGLPLLKCLHLNDSKAAPGSRLDRHEWIGEGTIGAEPFRRILQDARLAKIIKIIETPKGDDPVTHDRRMLDRLRSFA